MTKPSIEIVDGKHRPHVIEDKEHEEPPRFGLPRSGDSDHGPEDQHNGQKDGNH
jgi:hypothetical protein